MTDFSSIDTVMVYQLFTAFVGDIEKTALAADLAPSVVKELADKFDWIDKIKRTSILRKEGKPGEWEICCNRAISFSQAHLFRSLIGRVIANLAKKDDAGLIASLSTVKAGAVTISGKLFSDMASALEKSHHLCYLSLNDHAAARESAPTEAEETMSMASLHQSVLAALSAPAAAGAEQKLLEDSIEDLVKVKVPPKPPEDA